MAKPGLRVRVVPIDSVTPDPRNMRVHDEKNLAAIKASLNRFGQRKPIVLTKSGVVCAGNGTLMAARELKWETIAVADSDLEGEEASAYAIADNRAGELAGWDPSLVDELNRIGSIDGDLADSLGFDDDAMRALAREAKRSAAEALLGEGDGDRGDESPADAPELVRGGELWLLGAHRLMCGDSTVPEDVERLLRGERGRLFATDPPYGIEYGGDSNHPQNYEGVRYKPDAEWDGEDKDGSFYDIAHATLQAWLPHLEPRCPIYIWHAFKKQHEAMQAFTRNGILPHQAIVWDKTRIVPTRAHYGWQTEQAIYGWVKGMQPEKDRRPPPSASNLWAASTYQDGDKIHHTQKPIVLFELPILYHTMPGEVVLEPFAGSGSQIMAAERHGRKCLAMERDPRACDRILVRFEAATGKKPVRG
jgi:DNA modification methylase